LKALFKTCKTELNMISSNYIQLKLWRNMEHFVLIWVI